MNKTNLWVDFDNVVVSTTEALVDCIHHLYINHEEFKSVFYRNVKNWNLTDAFPFLNENDIEDIFKTDLLWEYIKPYKGMVELLLELSQTGFFNIRILSIGSPENISRKAIWCNKHLGFIDEFVFITKTKNCHPDKSMINYGESSIMLDDNVKNLNCGAKYNTLVCFDGLNKEWQEGWDFENNSYVTTVDELKREIMSIVELEGLI